MNAGTENAAARRLAREAKTLRVMLELYCRNRHRGESGLCPECAELWDYARSRLERCPFLPDKPACSNCTVHCFKPELRKRVRAAMRYAGPRMAWRHPLLSLRHWRDSRRAARGSSNP